MTQHTPTTNQRKQDRAPTYLTQDEVRQLFAAIKDKRDRAIFAVAYRHGLRASEIGMLQTTDVDLGQARITQSTCLLTIVSAPFVLSTSWVAIVSPNLSD